MLAVLSPAKKLNPAPSLPPTAPPLSQPVLAAEAAQLAAILKQHSEAEIASLMKISDRLAELNQQRYQLLDPLGTENAKQNAEQSAEQGTAAGLLFQGDVYQGLEMASLAPDALVDAQARLRILSGLYGLLRPFDRIQPHRLEMGTRLKTDRGASLYDFWGQRITTALRQAAEASGAGYLVNLASEEYARAVDWDKLGLPVLRCQFKESRGGKLRIISFSAKKARGLMARYLLSEGIDRPEGLKAFALDGYRYEAALSNETSLLFVR
jgi:cytoplasmic iron level regulating protein YaaA (DUF328/UPF0246 family)